MINLYKYVNSNQLRLIKIDFLKIPTHIELSENCKDLLKRLLQRNPEYRISFEQFFNHPFIDLEHMPCPESIKKAVNPIK
jgi:serine/threonine-protein kinase ULK3